MPRNQAIRDELNKPEAPENAPVTDEQSELAGGQQSAPAISAELQAMLAQMVANAVATAGEGKQETKEVAAAPRAADVQDASLFDPHELVKIKLVLDKQHTDPLYVCINEYSERIPRGVYYPVPFYVAKHIEEMEQQDANTVLMIAGLSDEYERKAKEFGVG